MLQGKVAAVFTSVALVCGVCAAQASAYIYWSTANTNAIGRANQNGSGVNPNFLVTGSATELDQIAIDGSHIYWTSPEGGTIGRASLEGTQVEPNFISGLNEPTGLAVTSQFIYWSSNPTASTSGSIGRAELDGHGVNNAFVTGLLSPEELAVGDGHIYWDSGGLFNGNATPNEHEGFAIGDVELSGAGVNQTLIQEAYGGPAVNSSNLFWANYIPVGEPQLGYNTIGRASPSGSAVNENFIALGGGQFENGANDVAVDANDVYWTHNLIESGWIGRANLDGSDVNQSFITGIVPGSIAVNELPASGGAGHHKKHKHKHKKHKHKKHRR